MQVTDSIAPIEQIVSVSTSSQCADDAIEYILMAIDYLPDGVVDFPRVLDQEGDRLKLGWFGEAPNVASDPLFLGGFSKCLGSQDSDRFSIHLHISQRIDDG